MKDAVPDSPQDFRFKITGRAHKRFTLDDDKDPERSNEQTFRRLKSGTYTVTEKPTSGWWLTQLVCDTGERIDLAKRRVRIRLSAKEHVTCTFTNLPPTGGGRRPQPAARGAITIVKDAVPDGPQVFPFSSTLTNYQQFFLDDDPKTVRPNSVTIAGLRSGTFEFFETIPADWELARRRCTVTGGNGSESKRLGANGIRIKLKAGDHVVCTFRNEQFGTMRIAKQAVPAEGSPAFPFAFHLRGQAPFPFSVTVGRIDNKFTYPPGKYAFTEGEVDGWKLTDIKCTTGEQPDVARRRVDITLDPGEDVLCTFTNAQNGAGDQGKRGSLTIVKNAVPDDGLDFFFTVTPDVAITPFRLDDDADPAFPNGQTIAVKPGIYTISEQSTEGWETTVACSDGTKAGGRNIDVTVKADADLVCTFTNTKQGEFGAVLTIFKDARPNDAQDFQFTIAPRIALTPFRLDDDDDPAFYKGRALDVAPGTYTITELEATGGWETKVSCSNGVSAADRSVQVTLAPDEHVLCTFTNTKPGEGGAVLTVVKDARPNSPQDFLFTVSPRVALTAFRLDDDDDPAFLDGKVFDVAPGTYTIMELEATGGWETSVTCSKGQTSSGRSIEVTLAAEEHLLCRFTNTKPGEGGATLTLLKDAQPDSGHDFGFTITPKVALTLFRLDDDSDPTHPSSRTFDAAPGTYTITEAEASGWETSVACDNGVSGSGRSVEVTLEVGDHVTCTFTNSRPVEPATLTIVEDVKPDDDNMFNAQDFHYLVGSGGIRGVPGYLYEEFDLDDDQDPALPRERTFSDLTPGNYSLEQPSTFAYNAAQTGFPVSGISCDTGERGGAGPPADRKILVALDPGEHITCTFTNQRLPGRLRIGVLYPTDLWYTNPVFNFTTVGPGLHPFTIDRLTPTAIDFEGLDAVSYTITQSPPSFPIPAGTVRLYNLTCESMVGESFAPGAGLQIATPDVASGRLDLIVRPNEDNFCTFFNTLESPGDTGGPAPGALVAVTSGGQLVASVDTGPGREIAGRFDQSSVSGPRVAVSPDATTAYVTRRTEGGSRCQTEIARVSLADASAEVVVGNAASPALSPDGTRLAYVALTTGNDGCEATLKVRDLATGEEREFPTEQGVSPGGLAWAGDGRRLAFDRADGVVVIFDSEGTEGPAAGTEIRPQASPGRGRTWSLVGFVGDDTLLVQAGCTRTADCPGRTRLVTVELGDPERAHPAGTLPRRVHDVVVDATGGIVVYVRGSGPAGAGRLEWLPLGAGGSRPSVIAEDIIGVALLGATTEAGGP